MVWTSPAVVRVKYRCPRMGVRRGPTAMWRLLAASGFDRGAEATAAEHPPKARAEMRDRHTLRVLDDSPDMDFSSLLGPAAKALPLWIVGGVAEQLFGAAVNGRAPP